MKKQRARNRIATKKPNRYYRNILFYLIVIIIVVCCISMPESNESVPASQPIKNFSDITGKEFVLTEVYIDDINTGFNRNGLVLEGHNDDIFTITFDGRMLAGTGSPNRYSAPYTLENENGISVKLIRSTLMAAFREPEKLKEHEYYVYLQNAYKWNIANENLELHSKTENNANVLMIFIVKP
ncbi:MAG: META domain-containing protein [Treponema sp.]|jgi:hypothetical protein|nr:META domain-containing protein [Treponema sp.]